MTEGAAAKKNLERTLALAHVPGALRPALAAVLALDDQLGHLTLGTRDPTLAAMRLLWWHDAVAALATGPAPAHPILQAIVDEVLPLGLDAAELARIADGWSALLDEEADGEERAARHGSERGARSFRLLAGLIGLEASSAVERAGRGVALAQLAGRTASRELAEAAAAQASLALAGRSGLSRRAKPLAMMRAAERTGLRGGHPSGAPPRLAAMWRVALNPF